MLDADGKQAFIYTPVKSRFEGGMAMMAAPPSIEKTALRTGEGWPGSRPPLWARPPLIYVGEWDSKVKNEEYVKFFEGKAPRASWGGATRARLPLRPSRRPRGSRGSTNQAAWQAVGAHVPCVVVHVHTC